MALAIVAVGLVGLARWQAAPLASNLLFDLAVVAVSGGLGFLLGTTATSLLHPPWRDASVALAAALGAVALVLVWTRLEGRFAAPEWQWLRSMAGGINVLPALLPAALVRRVGAALLGLAVQALAVAFSGVVYAAAALLYVPLVTAPVELWLLARHQDGSAVTLALAGALLGGVGAVLTRPELLVWAGLWPLTGAVVSTAVGGALFGLLAYGVADWLRPRLGLGDFIGQGGWS